MYLAIISTTINGEGGYLRYDRLAQKSKFSKINFFIAGDLKSAPFDKSAFSCEVRYLSPKEQERFYCSEAIGWNKIMRRTIALLVALETNPDYILSIDDDNIPPKDYFEKWHKVLTRPVRKIAIPQKKQKEYSWHNYLKTSNAPIEIYPRGFPIPFRGEKTTHLHSLPIRKAVNPRKIGLFQAISLGDPDISAKTRIVYPKRLPLTKIKEKNYCLRDVWSPYNTQNTLFAKKLFPLIATWPHCGRFDDIYASFVWQKFLFNNGMYVHVGDPLHRQDRGVRDILIDFKNEVEGYLQSHYVWEEINKIQEKDPLKFIEKLITSRHQIIRRQNKFFKLYLKDLKRIYKNL